MLDYYTPIVEQEDRFSSWETEWKDKQKKQRRLEPERMATYVWLLFLDMYSLHSYDCTSCLSQLVQHTYNFCSPVGLRIPENPSETLAGKIGGQILTAYMSMS